MIIRGVAWVRVVLLAMRPSFRIGLKQIYAADHLLKTLGKLLISPSLIPSNQSPFQRTFDHFPSTGWGQIDCRYIYHSYYHPSS